jgi:dihydrofolate reductase
MKKIRYAVAASLDGYIAGPKGEADWIIIDPEIDFEALFKRFDTMLMGRRTFAAMEKTGQAPMPGMETFVFSRTLQQPKHPNVTILATRPRRQWQLCAPSAERIFGFSGAALFFGVFSPLAWSIRSKWQSFRFFSVTEFRCSPHWPHEQD